MAKKKDTAKAKPAKVAKAKPAKVAKVKPAKVEAPIEEEERNTEKFVIDDAGTFRKVEESFSNLEQHIDEQDMPKENKDALHLMIGGFKKRISSKQNHFHNFTMLSQAAHHVNRYL